jgi:transposase
MHIAGIDAHAAYCVVGIVDNTGALVQKPLRIRNADRDRLVELLERHAPVEVVVEASPAWPWLYDLLDGVVTRFVLAHPKKLRAIAEANYKSDAIDATLLARMLLARLIPEVHCKSIEQRELVTLVRHRTRLVRLRTQAASRIHAELHAVGLCLARGRLLTRAGRAWVRETAWPRLGPEQRRLIRTHEELIDNLRRMARVLDRRIEAIGEEIPAVAVLQTVPGIGPFRGLLIAAEVQPIKRFVTPNHLVSYAGLAPTSARSGMRVRYGPIPAGANRWLRNAFVQAALVHRQRAPESWLSRYHDELRQRADWRVARVATARKLARAVHAMLRTGEVWRDEN